jgi:hypothetical protein
MWEMSLLPGRKGCFYMHTLNVLKCRLYCSMWDRRASHTVGTPAQAIINSKCQQQFMAACQMEAEVNHPVSDFGPHQPAPS